MPERQNVTFQEAIEIVESLPEYQQEDIINILQRRMLERRRELLVKNVRKARQEYARGEAKVGSVDDLMKDLSGHDEVYQDLLF
jgi:hypothetical protein